MTLISDIVLLQDLTASDDHELVELKAELPATVNHLTNPRAISF
ncbi:MAG: hypothetical protein V7K92_02015 [Nostoc sp.]